MNSALKLAALLGVGLVAQPVHAQSLSQALSSAYANNPTLNAARALTRSTHEGVAIARGGFRPQVFGSADLAGRTINNTPGTTRTGIDSTLSLNVEQNLFNGFQTVNATRGAESAVRAQQEALRSTEQDTLLSAVTAFADVIQNTEILRLNRNNLEFLNEQVRASQDRFEVGEGTRTDISQAQADRQAAVSQVLSSEANLAAARAVFFQVTGIEAKKLRRDIKINRLLPKSLQAALASGAREHPDIMSALHNVDTAAFNVKEQEGALLPTLSVEGNVSTQFHPVAGVSDRVDSASVVGRLTVPIYQGGIVSAQVRQSKEQLGQARINVDVARDQIRAEVVSAWNNLLAANASIRAAQAGVRAAELALDGVIEEQRVGQRTRLDILDQQSTLIDAQITLAQARRSQLVFAYTLVSSIGRLDARQLNLRIALHNPNKHYKKVRDKWIGLRTPDGR
ncbi:MAG: TolC family outer membrane protein [Pseudomonadota bacterium]